MSMVFVTLVGENIPVLRHFSRTWIKTSFSFLKKNFFFNVYLFLGQRETEHERGRGRERGRHRMGNRLQALNHQPRARRGARTHRPRDRDLAEVGRLTDCATQAPPHNPNFKGANKIPNWPWHHPNRNRDSSNPIRINTTSVTFHFMKYMLTTSMGGTVVAEGIQLVVPA